MAAERAGRGLRDRLAALRALRGGDREPSRRSPRLDQPVDLRRPLIRTTHDPDSFGRASESIARFLGTGRFLVYMTAVVLIWIGWNVVAPGSGQHHWRFDNYPFIFLTLMLSLQASYAAPLILLAQNRQDDRDRVNQDADRRTGAQSRADMEFLAREVASLRVALGEVATRDYVRSEIRSLVESLSELLEQDDEQQPARRAKKPGAKVGAAKSGKTGKDRQGRTDGAGRSRTVAELAADEAPTGASEAGAREGGVHDADAHDAHDGNGHAPPVPAGAGGHSSGTGDDR